MSLFSLGPLVSLSSYYTIYANKSTPLDWVRHGAASQFICYPQTESDPLDRLSAPSLAAL